MSQLVSTSPTVLVTGATDGIGYATARRFADDGATVYLHAPDQDSGENAMTRLVKDGAEPLRLHRRRRFHPPRRGCRPRRHAHRDPAGTGLDDQQRRGGRMKMRVPGTAWRNSALSSSAQRWIEKTRTRRDE